MDKQNIEERDGKKLNQLFKQLRHFRIRTLTGWIITDYFHHTRVMNEIEHLSKTIGGRAKTRIRKECTARGIPYPNFNNET